jgi:hypothetical protein
MLSDKGILYGALLKNRVIFKAERGEVASPNTACVEGDEARGLIEAKSGPMTNKETLGIKLYTLLSALLSSLLITRSDTLAACVFMRESVMR